MLSNSSISVQEIVPPWAESDLIAQQGSTSLKAFIAETMKQFATDTEEGVVAAALLIYNNASTNEQEPISAFNAHKVQPFGR